MNLTKIETAKINCAKQLFSTLSMRDVLYDQVDDFQKLMDRLMDLKR